MQRPDSSRFDERVVRRRWRHLEEPAHHPAAAALAAAAAALGRTEARRDEEEVDPQGELAAVGQEQRRRDGALWRR